MRKLNETGTALELPRVIIPGAVWSQMMAYVLNCPTEINGFGFVESINGDIYITEVFILDQIATAASVVVDPLAQSRFIDNLVRTGQDPGRMKFQWHSHVGMPAYFSSVDTNNIGSWPGDWLISLVLNKHGESSCRLDVLRPSQVAVAIQPQVVYPISREVMDVTAREIQDKVRSPAGLFRAGRPLTNGIPTAIAEAHVTTEALYCEIDGEFHES